MIDSNLPTPRTLVWFRRDLRVADHPALHEAVRKGGVIIPVYIHEDDPSSEWADGGATRWWLHHSLNRLDQTIRDLGGRLILRTGPPDEILPALVRETNANAVYWNRLYEPECVKRDTLIKRSLMERGLDVQSFNGNQLLEPWEIETNDGNPYKVFTPFYKTATAMGHPARPLPRPDALPSVSTHLPSDEIDSLGLLPTIPWDGGLQQAWRPGEDEAYAMLDAFGEEGSGDYKDDRDYPGIRGTSRLSPYLHFGEITPRSIYHKLGRSSRTEPYIRQLYWREFAHHLLYHFPHTVTDPLRPEFERFPWNDDPERLKAWQKGRTGFPIVDAGMRELWTTGWMHNRVRMITASFLVKDLLIPWQEGARWFWDTLVDADLANNTLGWQWTAGCGADAAPYFRIFNPILQSKKFDPDGDYLRTWLPELAELDTSAIHEPAAASDQTLKDAGVELGSTYPKPIVDHSDARDRALEAYDRIKGG